MWLVALIAALSIAALAYCGTKTVADARAERWGWVVAGGGLTILIPTALAFMAVTLLQFIRSGGL